MATSFFPTLFRLGAGPASNDSNPVPYPAPLGACSLPLSHRVLLCSLLSE